MSIWNDSRKNAFKENVHFSKQESQTQKQEESNNGDDCNLKRTDKK